MLPPDSAGQVMGLASRRAGDAVVLTVSGDLDLDNIAPLAGALAEEGKNTAGPVVLDLSGVGFADSTTVNVLLKARSELAGRLRIASPSAFVERLFEVIGLMSALPVYESVDDALAATVPPVPAGL